MKNHSDKYEKRGCIDVSVVSSHQKLSKEELIGCLDESPIIRTSCIYLITSKFRHDDDYTSILLNQLCREKAIYAKIEIQGDLAEFGNVYEMCHFLGKVGHNQHREILPRPTLKKSYPLPRDLVARSLGHMDGRRYFEFLEAMKTLKDEKQLLEAIDGFGFFCFYHRDDIDEQAFQLISQYVEQYQDNELMTWKLTICLSAFPESADLLLKIKQQQKHPTIQMEVERSLRLIGYSDNQ